MAFNAKQFSGGSARLTARVLSKAKLPIRFSMPTKENFFDRKAVVREVDQKTRRAFIRIGGFIRKSAQNSIRKARSSAPSPPGQPPRSRTGLLKKGIFFSYDQYRRSVIVGPIYRATARQPYSVPVPRVLEIGGRWRLRENNLYGTAVRYRNPLTGRFQKKSTTGGGRAGQVVHRHAHPYMGPALTKATRATKLKTFFRDIGQ